jgi:hypothetical protein
MDEAAAEQAVTERAAPRLALLAESHLRLTGRPLLADAEPTGPALWRAPFVLLAHGGGPDPVFFYGNCMALKLFEVTAGQLLTMPSRLSAEPDDRVERARLLETVSRQGFNDNYAGVRVSRTGRRFRIERATVWNLVDACGGVHGQAAAFAAWTPLD